MNQRIVTVPFSEAAMHIGIAGQTLVAAEEDTYINGHDIPEQQRRGCFVFMSGGQRVPLLKSEAGWDDGKPFVRSDVTIPVHDEPCPHTHLRFGGWLGAPGIGQSWDCVACGEALWSPGGADNAIPFKDLDPDMFIMSPEDCV